MKSWKIDLSECAKNTNNPSRKFFENVRTQHNPNIPVISLGLADSTLSSDIAKPEAFKVAISECINEKSCDSYQSTIGSEAVCTAVAKYSSRPDHLIYKPSDIIAVNGGNEAIDFCISVLANPGQNVLIPKPGFIAYKVLNGTLGIQIYLQY
jgi:tyrosine aminotransferase